MYPILITVHNWLRWLVVVAGVYALVRAYWGLFSRRPWTVADRMSGTTFSISMDVQFLVGLLLALTSPLVSAAMANVPAAMASDELRFVLAEHIPLMFLALVFVHVGTSGARRAADDRGRFRRVALWYTLSSLAILVSIPWWRPLLRLP